MSFGLTNAIFARHGLGGRPLGLALVLVLMGADATFAQGVRLAEASPRLYTAEAVSRTIVLDQPQRVSRMRWRLEAFNRVLAAGAQEQPLDRTEIRFLIDAVRARIAADLVVEREGEDGAATRYTFPLELWPPADHAALKQALAGVSLGVYEEPSAIVGEESLRGFFEDLGVKVEWRSSLSAATPLTSDLVLVGRGVITEDFWFRRLLVRHAELIRKGQRLAILSPLSGAEPTKAAAASTARVISRVGNLVEGGTSPFKSGDSDLLSFWGANGTVATRPAPDFPYGNVTPLLAAAFSEAPRATFEGRLPARPGADQFPDRMPGERPEVQGLAPHPEERSRVVLAKAHLGSGAVFLSGLALLPNLRSEPASRMLFDRLVAAMRQDSAVFSPASFVGPDEDRRALLSTGVRLREAAGDVNPAAPVIAVAPPDGAGFAFHESLLKSQGEGKRIVVFGITPQSKLPWTGVTVAAYQVAKDRGQTRRPRLSPVMVSLANYPALASGMLIDDFLGMAPVRDESDSGASPAEYPHFAPIAVAGDEVHEVLAPGLLWTWRTAVLTPVPLLVGEGKPLPPFIEKLLTNLNIAITKQELTP